MGVCFGKTFLFFTIFLHTFFFFFLNCFLHYEIENSEQDDYEVIRKVGRGKYSEVFEGLNISFNILFIIFYFLGFLWKKFLFLSIFVILKTIFSEKKLLIFEILFRKCRN